MRRLLILTLSALCVLAQPAWAITKIAPTEAEAGHPFTIIDTPDRRLVDGSVAVFRLLGTEVELPLRTHKPYNTAQGRLALDMYGGLYDVFVRRPDGSEIAVGLFLVLGPTVLPPFIEPDIGLPGTAFEITDPLARMQAGDLALFYAEGGDPAADGVPAANVVVDAVGRVLTGNVPSGVATGQNFVSVRPTQTAESRFGDLGFFVSPPPEPSIDPASGPVGTPFTITDPFGRMRPGDFCIFYEFGSNPETGTQVPDVVVSADGTTLMGTVPSGIPRTTLAVRVTSFPGGIGRFGDLEFQVTFPVEPPSISPTSGPVGTPFTITDELGRMQPGDVCLFYEPGSDPETGIQVPDVVVSADGTTLTGTVPDSLTEQDYAVSVRETPSSLSRFGDLEFQVTLTAEASISPTSGTVRSQFTITDPQGRMAGATVVVFFEIGQGPEQGTPVTDINFSADGTTATGTVPTTLSGGGHFVTVHRTGTGDPPVFSALLFTVL